MQTDPDGLVDVFKSEFIPVWILFIYDTGVFFKLELIIKLVRLS